MLKRTLVPLQRRFDEAGTFTGSLDSLKNSIL